jgi:hypothetical protein
MMARRAQQIVPEVVGLSLELVDDGLTFTLTASSDEIARIEAVASPDDPSMAGEPMDEGAPDLLDERQWSLYARATAWRGISSSLSLSITERDHIIGDVNLYAATPHAFAGHYEELARALGASAAGAVADADLAFNSRLEAALAPSRLADQNDIDRAVGVIAAGQAVDIETARALLRDTARRAGMTEAEAARFVTGRDSS